MRLFGQHLAYCSIGISIFAAAVLLLFTGCESTKLRGVDYPGSQGTNGVVLREADTLKILFPGAEQLNTTEVIRRDGKITLPTVGEVPAAGKTPAQFQKDLAQLFSKQLVSSKDITVVVVSSSFPVYVNGAVMRPGKVIADHPLTVLEAIMESGGFDYRSAKMKAVKVIRTQDGNTHNYTVNLDGVRTGKQVEIFYLQPFDIVYVPSKITWL